MMHNLTKRILVLFLAVFVTAGMGLPVVQASTMHLTAMKMSSDMKMSSPKDCQDCSKMGDGKAVPGCVAPACAAVVALLNRPPLDMNVAFSSVLQLDQTRAPDGARSEPAPYPPRTTHIG